MLTRVNRIQDVIKSLLNEIPDEATRLRVISRIHSDLKPTKGRGITLKSILAILDKKQVWQIDDLHKAAEKHAKTKLDRKKVFNALAYLRQRKYIESAGWRYYRVLKTPLTE